MKFTIEISSNIFFAERLAGATASNPCAWYFIQVCEPHLLSLAPPDTEPDGSDRSACSTSQILTDTTIVVLLNFALLRAIENHAAKEMNLDITSGPLLNGLPCTISTLSRISLFPREIKLCFE
jgi:hypothetical protein